MLCCKLPSVSSLFLFAEILQAMIDVCAESAWLATTLRAQQLLQQVVQGAWVNKSPLLTLPFFEPQHMYLFAKVDDPSLSTLPGLREACFNNYEKLASILRGDFDDGEIEQVALIYLSAYSIIETLIVVKIINFSSSFRYIKSCVKCLQLIFS